MRRNACLCARVFWQHGAENALHPVNQRMQGFVNGFLLSLILDYPHRSQGEEAGHIHRRQCARLKQEYELTEGSVQSTMARPFQLAIPSLRYLSYHDENTS